MMHACTTRPVHSAITAHRAAYEAFQVPAHRKLPAASPIPREEFERLAELALDIVDRIVAILDEGDGDPDREDGGDAEPSLGAPEGHESQVIWLRGGDDDRELA